MSELNVNVPITYCLLRAEYLYNGNPARKGMVIPCAIFGASSLQGRAIGFHCMLDHGALIYRLPISAFVHKMNAPDLPLDYLELWDCLSPQMTCTEYEFLAGMRVDVTLKDKTVEPGIYLYTLDWHGNSLSDNPGEGGHKCAHIIQLENGCYAAQPNNRLRWYEPSFITAHFPEKPDYQTNNRIFSVENKGPKWVTGNDNKLFYDIEAPTCPTKRKVLSKDQARQTISLDPLSSRYLTESLKRVEHVLSRRVKKALSGEKVRKTRR